MGAVGERGLHRRAGLQRAEHGHGGDGGAGEVGRDVGRDGGEAEHPDVERLSGRARRFEFVAAVVAQAEVEAPARHGVPGGIGVPLDLVADGGADKVGAVRVEAVLHQQIYVAEVHVAEVDRDLFGLAAGPGPQCVHIAGHCFTILLPSSGMVNGDARGDYQGAREPRRAKETSTTAGKRGERAEDGCKYQSSIRRTDTLRQFARRPPRAARVAATFHRRQPLC